MRLAINAAIIEDGKILLVRKKQTWILPGGKPQPEESDIECLCREVREELSRTELENIKFYRSFEGITPHKGDVLQAKVYFAKICGKLNQPSAEIKGAEWVQDARGYNLSDITSKIVDALKIDKYIG